MKKFISVLLATVMMASSVMMAFAKPVIKGDTNKDDEITARDARNILLYVVGKKTIEESERDIYDVDGNGFITALDSRKVLRMVAGLEEIPTAEDSTTEEPTTEEPTTEEPTTEEPTTEEATTEEPTTEETTQAPENEEISEEERMMRLLESKFLELVNEERVRVGVCTLKTNEILHKGARLRAIECLEVFSHTRPNGESYKTVLQGELDYTWEHIGENIAWCYETSYSTTDWTSVLTDKDMIDYAIHFFNTFKDSSVHYKNMIYSDFTECGFGVVITITSDGKLKVACSHLFGTPA